MSTNIDIICNKQFREPVPRHRVLKYGKYQAFYFSKPEGVGAGK